MISLLYCYFIDKSSAFAIVDRVEMEQKNANLTSRCDQKTHCKTGSWMQSRLKAMNIFSTVSVPMYFVCVSLEEQVGHATQAEFFKHRRISLYVIITAMLLAWPWRTNIPTPYDKMTKRHRMRTPFILIVGQLFPNGGSTISHDLSNFCASM